MNNTINPPNWDLWKKKGKKDAKSSALSFKKIEQDVNQLSEKFDSIFKSHLMKREILRSNPKLPERMIICEPVTKSHFKTPQKQPVSIIEMYKIQKQNTFLEGNSRNVGMQSVKSLMPQQSEEQIDTYLKQQRLNFQSLYREVSNKKIVAREPVNSQ